MVRCMQKTSFLLAFIFLLASVSHSVIAGNKEMVEKRVKELDQINKEIVGSMPNLPQKGHIKLKARVHPYDHRFKFDILKKEIIGEKQPLEGDGTDE